MAGGTDPYATVPQLPIASGAYVIGTTIYTCVAQGPLSSTSGALAGSVFAGPITASSGLVVEEYKACSFANLPSPPVAPLELAVIVDVSDATGANKATIVVVAIHSTGSTATITLIGATATIVGTDLSWNAATAKLSSAAENIQYFTGVYLEGIVS